MCREEMCRGGGMCRERGVCRWGRGVYRGRGRNCAGEGEELQVEVWREGCSGEGVCRGRGVCRREGRVCRGRESV